MHMEKEMLKLILDKLENIEKELQDVKQEQQGTLYTLEQMNQSIKEIKKSSWGIT